MANVRIKRAITYIALGATTSLGAIRYATAAQDAEPAGAPHAMSAPPPGALSLPERLSFPRTVLMAPLVLADPSVPHDASLTPERLFALAPPRALSVPKSRSLKSLTLALGKSEAAVETSAPVESDTPAGQTVATAAVTQPRSVVAVAAEGGVADDGAPLTPVVAEGASLHGDTALPLPEALVPQVNFWKRVYTEIDTHHGFVHDAWHLDVVYGTIAVPGGTRRQSARGVSQQLCYVAKILRDLAHGHRDNPTAEQARVLAAWPKDVTNATLLEAARNVRFQTGQSDKFKAGLVRAQTWTPFIVSTFTAAGLPRELAALPHVESSFNMMAYSKVRAAGIWQFMPSTARLFMHMDSTVDERLDPIRSTESAAHLLAQNYRLLGSWPLAITAYNHGPRGMHRAMKVTGSNDLATIIGKYKTKHFGFASRNFYTELLAAWEVSQHPEKYFGQLPTEAPVQYETVTTDAFYRVKSVAAALGVELAVLREHNPALRPAVWTSGRMVPRGFTFRVPRGMVRGDMLAMLGAIPQGERYAHADVLRARPASTSRHAVAMAVAHLSNTHATSRRIVAQRNSGSHAKHATVAAVATQQGATKAANAVAPWDQKPASDAASHTAPAAATRAWYE